MEWDIISDVILISAFITLGVFVALGIYQWIQRKSIEKVDKRLLWMPLPLGLMAITYFIFDKLIILNTRPDGSGDPSFPSTHVMVVTTIFFLTLMNLPKYVKSQTARIVIEILILILICLVCSGRLLSDMHWLIDVLGGLIFAFIFTEIYYFALHHKFSFQRSRRKKSSKKAHNE